MPYSYVKGFTPPFPILPVVLYQVGTQIGCTPVNALIDTGSDATLVPISYLNELQVESAYPGRMRSHWSEFLAVDIYFVDLKVEGELLPAVQVVGDRRGKDIILGRNVLNRLILLLDGVHQQSEVLTRRPRRL